MDLTIRSFILFNFKQDIIFLEHLRGESTIAMSYTANMAMLSFDREQMS